MISPPQPSRRQVRHVCDHDRGSSHGKIIESWKGDTKGNHRQFGSSPLAAIGNTTLAAAMEYTIHITCNYNSLQPSSEDPLGGLVMFSTEIGTGSRRTIKLVNDHGSPGESLNAVVLGPIENSIQV
jgi:hypothetical protein